MSDLHVTDYELMKSYWRLVPHTKRDYWDVTTVAFVQSVLRHQLRATYAVDQLDICMIEARNAVAEELGIPPWQP